MKNCRPGIPIPKFLLFIMRVTFFLFVVGVFQIYAVDSYAQKTQLTIHENEIELGELFNKIERQTDFYFFYSNDQINKHQKVTVNVKDKTIYEVLDIVLYDTGITYQVNNKAIVLSTRELSTIQQSGKRQIKGKIIDQQGEPIIGANVLEKGTTNGVVTDYDGNFFVSVPPNATLQISYIGYLNQEVVIGDQNDIKVILSEDDLLLEEVVVVGFGTQKKVNLTGAVSSVSGEEITRRPVSNTATMLQAQVPGLRVSQGRGQPGDENTQFRIRGQGTFSNAGSNPLVLINGVEGDIASLDPNIIESVSVLKDASSASIYGSRAANGVILVTTKTGSGIKDNVRVSYNGNFAVYQPISVLDLIWDSPQYMKYYNIAKTNSNASADQRYTDEVIAVYSDPNRDKIQYPSFNWVDYMFTNPFVHTHNLNASGSSSGGKTSYNISLNYLDQPGTIRGSEFNRINAAIDISSNINKYIRTGAYFSGSRGNRQATVQGDEDAYLSTISQAPTYMPWLPDDGTGVIRWTHKAYVHEGNNKNMPAIIASNTFRTDNNTDMNLQYWLEINPFEGLTWYNKAATRMRFNRYKEYYADPLPQYYYHTGDYSRQLDSRGPGLNAYMNMSTYFNYYSTLKYDFGTKNQFHKFSVMGGFSMEMYDYDWMKGHRKNFLFPLEELDAGTAAIQTAEGSKEQWRLLSWFGRFNYSYKDKYLFDANARYDGTSRIAKENRWGVFPSFSAGWRLTEEDFIKDASLNWLNNLKIRGSWGQLGNQNIDLYSYNSVVVPDISYPYNNSTVSTGVAQKNFSNRNLIWETTTIIDVGADLTLFKGLNIVFDWYSKKTTDILRRAQATDLLGLTAPYVNDGEMVNKGIEMSTQYNNIVKSGFFKDLYYNMGFYLDCTRNEMTKFGAEEISSGRIRKEGLPDYTFYLYDAIGIFKDKADVDNSPKQFTDTTQPGDIKYRDISGPNGTPDGIINEYDRTTFGGRFPDFEYGINANLKWKGFDFSILGQGVQGIKHYAKDWGIQPFRQGSPPSKDYIKNMWTEENPNGKYPRLYFDNMGGTKNTRESTFYLYDGSFFRLKNLTLGYTLPNMITGNVLESVRVYFAADNLFTLTKYPQGGDPDRLNDSSSGSRLVRYPQNRILSVGVNVNF